METTEENEEVTTEEVLEENDLVAAQSALTEGWHTDSEGNRTYVKEGNLVKNNVISIDDAYYGFDSNGKCMQIHTFLSGIVNFEEKYGIEQKGWKSLCK